MAKKFKIELGDPSDDGHGKCDEVTIKTLGTDKDIDKAFAKLKTKGIDFREICVDYEDSQISEELLKKMKKLGVEVDDLLEEMKEEESESTYLDVDKYVGLMIDCLNAVNPKLKIEIIEKDYIPSIGIFGYGLF